MFGTAIQVHSKYLSGDSNYALNYSYSQGAEIHAGYLKQTAGSHVVFYRRLSDELIEIVRILHRHMDIESRLSDRLIHAVNFPQEKDRKDSRGNQ
jgi:hypothetical protein